ncbi:sialate O-acetylesterase [Bacteriovoracaceae bacterium]|nr:sialate O-acetylesterase [Bacteriovoracaceae bacterium]
MKYLQQLFFIFCGIYHVSTNAFVIESPKTLQVFQRENIKYGKILIRLEHLSLLTDEIRIVISDHVSNRTIHRSSHIITSQSFRKLIQLPAGGWYRLDVTSLGGNQKIITQKTITKLGLGEIFIGAGQSNSTNAGLLKTKTKTKMVVNFDGKRWRIANDPQLGPHDNSTGGSFWPSFGDALYRQIKVPIAVVPTGHGGTSINRWKTNGELFRWTNNFMNILKTESLGFRAVLWHQGENDVDMDSEEYYQKTKKMILDFKEYHDQPWFVAKVSYLSIRKNKYASTRSAQTKLWDNQIALEGPDTDTLRGFNRDYLGFGIHFSKKGLKKHGRMWANTITQYLDSLISK